MELIDAMLNRIEDLASRNGSLLATNSRLMDERNKFAAAATPSWDNKPGVIYPGAVTAMLIAMATPGGKIDAIRHYRAMTGRSLQDCKDTVERAMGHLVVTS